jgi:tRNA(Glu) U13 pseudouridine synthase TruD
LSLPLGAAFEDQADQGGDGGEGGEEDEVALCLTFSLPPSAYATVALREVTGEE